MNQDCIITYSKAKFSPLCAKKEDIEIVDIAHALSMMCRANGHIKHFYSVAQHSLNCLQEAKARKLSGKVQLACLLHDASEAYISDITRPVKRSLPQYREYEAVLQSLIYSKFGLEDLTEVDNEAVCSIDDGVLFEELLYLMDEEIFDRRPGLLSLPDLELREFSAVEQEFLQEFKTLTSAGISAGI